MKKRVFINIHYLEIGGAERALIGLLSAFDPEKVDVDLFVNQHTGEFMKYIPSYVNLLPEIPEYTAIERPMSVIAREGHLRVATRRLWARWKHKQHSRRLTDEQAKMDSSIFQYVFNAVEGALPSLARFGEYDLAISFITPHNIVLHKVNARKKMCWIHTDYSTVRVNHDLELPVWQGYDYIASISDDCTRSFVKCFPELESKIVPIENILSPKFVRDCADEYDVSQELDELDGGHCVRLLSVGRFSLAKNYDNVPDICSRIVNQGVDVRWYIIGYGGDEPLIRAKIAEAGMEERVILLGKKENPYPYIKACDIYVQPSRFEGKSVTVREAQMLCKPTIITDYPTAASQVQNGQDGVIVPLDNELCAEGIVAFINNEELQQRITEHLRTHDYGNEAEVEKVYALISR